MDGDVSQVDCLDLIVNGERSTFVRVDKADMLPSLLRERSDVVKLLRELCAAYGDTDWPDSLHLYDVIEKHLARHLYRRFPPPRRPEG